MSASVRELSIQKKPAVYLCQDEQAVSERMGGLEFGRELQLLSPVCLKKMRAMLVSQYYEQKGRANERANLFLSDVSWI